MQVSTTSEERAVAVCCHLLSLVATSVLLNLLVPLVIMMISDSPFVKGQAKECLNFQISIMFWAFISFLCCFIFIGFGMFIILAILALVLPIVAAFSVGGGEAYRYPLTFRLVK
ncbi:MAG TPA: DUF4870 domain-containing protein [Drouetiella sp.]